MSFKKIYPIFILLFIIMFLVIIKSEKTYSFLSTLDVEEIRMFIKDFGLKAPLIFILLQISQAVIAPIPGFLFTIAGGIIFGAFLGAVLSIIGSMIGAMICFLLAKKYGRPFINKIIKREDLGIVDDLFEKNGLLITTILRAIPVISFGLISYLISVTNINLKDYLIGTFIGLIPTIIFYTYFGFYILENPVISTIIGLILLTLFFLIPLTFPFLKRIKKKKAKS